MRKETAIRLYNRLNRTLIETLEVLSMLTKMLETADLFNDYITIQTEMQKLEVEKEDLLKEMSKISKSF